MKGIFIVITLLTAALCKNALSQVNGPYKIIGVVQDTATLKPINNALIIVANSGNSKSYYTTKDGSFTIRAEGTPTTITISQYGYHNKNIQLLPKDSLTNLGIIKIQSLSINLREITIKGQNQIARINKDTTEFSSSSFELNPNAQLSELLKKLPGLEILSDGSISFNGEKIERILIDGQEYFGSNILMALKNISAEMINKMQIITTNNLTIGTGATIGIEKIKVLNLTIKDAQKDKLLGNAQLGSGTNKSYLGTLALNRFGSKQHLSIIANMDNINGIQEGKPKLSNGINKTHEIGINNNYTIDPRNSISTNILFSSLSGYNQNHNRREYINMNPTGHNSEDMESTAQTNTLSIDVKNVIKPDSQRRITQRLLLRNIWRNMENTSNYSIYFANSNLDITGNSKNKTSAITQSYSYTNDFIRKLNYLDGSFSQRLYVAYNDSRDKTDYLSQYFQKSDDSTQSTHINNYNPLKQKSTSITGISSLTFKISPATSFLGFYSATYINSTANNQAFDKDSIILSKLTPIDSLNNSWDFKQRQNFILLGLNVNTTKFEGSFNFNWLIRKQEIFPSNSKAAEINWNFMYPRIDLTYYFNKTTILNYTLNYEPSNISPSQLITTKNFQNPLIVQSGNPNLKNPTKQNMTLRFSSFNPKSLSNSTTILTYSATNQKIVNNIYFDSLGRQVLTPINLDHSKMLSWGTTWSKPFFKRRLAINLRNNILYANDPVAVSGILGTSESLSIAPSIAINYTKKDLIDIQSSFAANRTYSTYNLGAVTKNEVTSLTMNLDVTGYLPLGFIAGVKYNKVINSGLAAGFNRSVDLLNVFVSKRLLKNKMEIKAQGFDLLNKNNSFTRTFTPTYFEDTQSTVLQRFFMGSIIYYIK